MSQPTAGRPHETVETGTDDERAALRIDGAVFEAVSLSEDEAADGARVTRWLETWSDGLP